MFRAMPSAYHLILEQDKALTTKTVLVGDAQEAWRLGRKLYPDPLRGVVCRDVKQTSSDMER